MCDMMVAYPGAEIHLCTVVHASLLINLQVRIAVGPVIPQIESVHWWGYPQASKQESGGNLIVWAHDPWLKRTMRVSIVSGADLWGRVGIRGR